MYELNKYMKFYIMKKFEEKWRNLKIIFSGTDVPGEGEHKIMEFIRKLK